MSVRKGLAVFCGISFAVSSCILAITIDGETLTYLASMRKSGILISLVLVSCAWLLDAARFCLLARAAQEHVSLRLGLILTWLNYFGAAITPLQSGGGPFQVYFLYRGGVPIGKGVAITLTRTLLTLFILGFVVPIALAVDPGFLRGHRFLQGVFSYVVVFVLISWTLVALSLIRPRFMKRLGSIIVLLIRRMGFLKSLRVLKLVRRINREIDNYNQNFRLFFSSGKFYFLGAMGLSCLHLLALFSVLPVLIWALGLPPQYIHALFAQALFLFVLYFVPTPGGSGVAEGGGAILFRLLLPWNLAGIMAIIWRFFTEYLAIGMGALVAIRILGWGLTEQLMGRSRNDKRFS